MILAIAHQHRAPVTTAITRKTGLPVPDKPFTVLHALSICCWEKNFFSGRTNKIKEKKNSAQEMAISLKYFMAIQSFINPFKDLRKKINLYD